MRLQLTQGVNRHTNFLSNIIHLAGKTTEKIFVPKTAIYLKFLGSSKMFVKSCFVKVSRLSCFKFTVHMVIVFKISIGPIMYLARNNFFTIITQYSLKCSPNTILQIYIHVRNMLLISRTESGTWPQSMTRGMLLCDTNGFFIMIYIRTIITIF